MKVRYLTSVLLPFIMLAGCGSDNTSQAITEPSQPTVSHTARVAAGFSGDNATACIDINNDKQCTNDEPSAAFDTNGYATFTGITQDILDSNPIVAKIQVNILDQNTHALKTVTITSMAPAGYQFLSPYSLLVQHYIDQGDELLTAEQKVKRLVGSDISPNDDYLAKQADENLTSDERKRHLKRHDLAHIWHILQAMNMDRASTHNEAMRLTHKQKMALVIDRMKENIALLKGAANRFYHNGRVFTNHFNQLDRKTKQAAFVDFTNAENQYAHLQNKMRSESVDLIDLYRSNHIHHFSNHEVGTGHTLKFSSESINPETNILSLSDYVLNTNDGVFEPSTQNEKEPYLYLSTADGWVQPNSQFKVQSVNDDNSLTMVNTQYPELQQIHKAFQHSLDGIMINTPFLRNGPTSKWKEATNDNAYSTNAKAIKITKTNVAAVYTRPLFPDCPTPNLLPREQCFETIPFQKDGSLRTEDSGLDDMFSTTLSEGNINTLKGPLVAINASQYIIAELSRTSTDQESGSVIFYKVEFEKQTVISGSPITVPGFRATVFSHGEWQTRTIGNHAPLYVIALPDDVFSFNTSKYIQQLFIITEHNGIVGNVEFNTYSFPSTITPSALTLNAPARSDVLQNTDVDTPPKNPPLDTILSECIDLDQISLQVLAGLVFEDDSIKSAAIGIARRASTPPTTFSDYVNAYHSCRVELNSTEIAAFDPTGNNFVAFDDDQNIDQILSFNEDNSGFMINFVTGSPVSIGFRWEQLSNTQIEITFGNEGPRIQSRVRIGITGLKDDVISTQQYVEDAELGPLNGTKGYIASQLYKVLEQ
ncbi:hypothetical protein D5R81_16905 [Parashewanella spongiae]|uniref:Uncharacterized protein n=1 Tax=Parashewanella spongiae TaxID=342950 RepID=A0A3A6TH60_9GAMM|nr:hypothetical protein [Parashewanella spongiae]MCL1079756.1 hypothetical protein [Parashewanella spongiae]RJY06985.1 hypothetical protein D5R81_16905 [Parashewanella spongiae]